MNAFFDWLSSNHGKGEIPPSGNREFEEMKTLWDASRETRPAEIPDAEIGWLRLKREMAKPAAVKRRASSRLTEWFSPRPRLAFAGICILILAGVWIIRTVPDTFKAGRGEIRTLVLPDGSEITLNSGSRLSVPKDFNTTSRVLSLKGEAFFQVVSNGLPFQVKTDAASVQVVGTQFNVFARNGRAEVEVTEGIVNFRSLGEQDSSVILTKGQRSRCEEHGFPESPWSFETRFAPGWMHHRLIADRTPVRDILDEIERRFDVRIECADQATGAIPLSGSFESENPDDLLKVICLLIEKEAVYDKRKIIIQ